MNRGHVEQIIGAKASTPAAANTLLKRLRTLINYSIALGWRNTDPTKGVKKYGEAVRERVLSREELQALTNTLNRLETTGQINPYLCSAIRLMVLTGCKKTDIRTLEWSMVDLDHGFLHLKDAKKSEHLVPLSKAARLMLQALPRKSRFAFPSSRTSSYPMASLDDAWKIIRAHAGLQDVRLQDLRTTFAALLIKEGAAMEVVAEILGFRHSQSIERFSFLKPLLNAVDKIDLG